MNVFRASCSLTAIKGTQVRVLPEHKGLVAWSHCNVVAVTLALPICSMIVVRSLNFPKNRSSSKVASAVIVKSKDNAAMQIQRK